MAAPAGPRRAHPGPPARRPGGSLPQRALRRSKLRLTVQLALAISVAVTTVAIVAYAAMVERQDAAIDATLDYTIAQPHAGALDPCTWLFIATPGTSGMDGPATTAGAEQAPPGLPYVADLVAVAAGHAAIRRDLSTHGNRYAVLTTRSDGQVRQAVFDERYPLSDRRHFAGALLAAGGVGLILACLAGLLLAQRAIAPLRTALTRQRQFVADASHELRAPLTRLHTRTQLLLEDAGGTVPPELTDHLRRLASSSRELTEVVDDLLRSARITTGPPETQLVDLRALTRAVALADGTVAAGPRVSAPATATDGSADATVVGGATALRRMVSALLDNAIRHAGPDGRVWLTVSATDRGRVVELRVNDDGPGLGSADPRMIFQRFHRGSGPTGRYGLGLALVHEVVVAHGGTVTAGDRPGGGAAFTVRLPAAPHRRPRRVTRNAVPPGER